MAKQTSSLGSFRNWPHTKKIRDPRNKGVDGYEIRDSYNSPTVSPARNFCTFIVVAWVTYELFSTVEYKQDPDFFYAVLFGLPVFGVVVWGFFRWLFNAVFVVRIFRDRVEVAGWRKLEVFTPFEKVRFGLETTLTGQIQEMEWRQNPRRVGFHFNSQLVVLFCFNEAYPIAYIYPKKKAVALKERLSRVHGYLALLKT